MLLCSTLKKISNRCTCIIFARKVLKTISYYQYFIDQSMLSFIFLSDSCINTMS